MSNRHQRIIGAGFALIAGFGIAALSMCSTTQVANTATQLQAICQAAVPVVQNATAATALNPTVASLNTYLVASCNADGTVAAALAPNVTNATPAWLEDIINGITIAAKIAPIVLPLL